MNEEERNAKAFAFKLLAKRAYTRKEVMRKLRHKNFSDDVSLKVLENLEESGLIDDKFYAACFAQTHQEWGIRRILLELRKRGISEEHIEEVKKTFGEEEFAKCLKLASQWREHLSREQIRSRLIRRGFNSSAIRRALDMTCEDAC